MKRIIIFLLLYLPALLVSAQTSTQILKQLKNKYKYVYYNQYDGTYKVESQDKKYGICDSTGTEIIPTTRGYTGVYFIEEKGRIGYYSVERGHKKGVCDITGKEIIPCKYKSVFFSSDGWLSPL